VSSIRPSHGDAGIVVTQKTYEKLRHRIDHASSCAMLPQANSKLKAHIVPE
jgi:hypothetical protein